MEVLSSEKNVDTSFFQPLLPGFLDGISIPTSFVKKLEGILQGQLNSVVLVTKIEPKRKWVVQLEGGRHFKAGWKDFCVFHSLRVGDFVIFRHSGRFHFQVSIYDPATACECYRLPSTRAKLVPAHKRGPKMVTEEGLTCQVLISQHAATKHVIYLRKKFATSSGLANRRCHVTLIDRQKRSWVVKLAYKKSDGQVYLRQGWKEFQRANALQPGHKIRFQLLKSGTHPVLECCRE